jgi:hypothetical protein
MCVYCLVVVLVRYQKPRLCLYERYAGCSCFHSRKGGIRERMRDPTSIRETLGPSLAMSGRPKSEALGEEICVCVDGDTSRKSKTLGVFSMEFFVIAFHVCTSTCSSGPMKPGSGTLR